MNAKDIMKKDFIRVNKDDSISQFANSLKKDKHRTGLVFDENIFIGIISFKQLMHVRMQPNLAKVGNFVIHVPHIKENTDLLDIAYFMYHSKAKALPVFDHDDVVGIVEASDVIAQIKNYADLKNKKVEQLSLKPCTVVNENDKLAKLLQILQDGELNSVPVVDSKKALSGVVSSSDVIEKYFVQTARGDHGSGAKSKGGGISYEGELPNLNALPVSNFMVRNDLVCALKSDNLGKISSLMLNYRVSSVIIVDGKNPVAVVPERDLLGEIVKLKEFIKFLIRYNGLNDLKIEEMSKEMVKKMSVHHAEKLENYLGNIQEMAIHFKQSATAGKEGKRYKFNVHVRVTDGTRTFTSSKANGWNIFRVLHDSFIDLENQLRHKFHTDSPLADKRKGALARKKKGIFR